MLFEFKIFPTVLWSWSCIPQLKNCNSHNGVYDYEKSSGMWRHVIGKNVPTFGVTFCFRIQGRIVRIQSDIRSWWRYNFFTKTTSAVTRYLGLCETSRYIKPRNKSNKTYGRYTALCLHTGRWCYVLANIRTRKFALHKQRTPIHQLLYTQLALTKTRVTAELNAGLYYSNGKCLRAKGEDKSKQHGRCILIYADITSSMRESRVLIVYKAKGTTRPVKLLRG